MLYSSPSPGDLDDVKNQPMHLHGFNFSVFSRTGAPDRFRVCLWMSRAGLERI